MRDAESTLDQLISFCGDKIEEADVLSMFGLAAQNQILKLSHAVLAGEISSRAHAIGRTGARRQRPGPAARRFAEPFPQPADLPGFQGRFEFAGSFRGRSRRVERTGCAGQHRMRSRASSKFSPTPNCGCAMPRQKRFCSKSPLLRAIEARNALPLDAVLKQLNQLRAGQGGAGVVPASAAAAPSAVLRRERRAPARPVSEQ